MNIGSFLWGDVALYGVFEGDRVFPASAAVRNSYSSLRDLLDAGALAQLRAPGGLGDPFAVADIVFLPPVPNPRRILCIGLNYVKPYPVDAPPPPNPEHILVFGKERAALVGHDTPLERPRGAPADSFDYEGEIAAVIGTRAQHVSPENALSHVLGYSVFNDGSVREWQKHSLHAGKNFARSGSWGPWITTADALPAPEDMELRVRLNGDTVQEARGSEMIFSLADVIAYLSAISPLLPGDVIATGSPDGTGGSRTPKRYLGAGDVVEMQVTGIGTLRNPVA